MPPSAHKPKTAAASAGAVIRRFQQCTDRLTPAAKAYSKRLAPVISTMSVGTVVEAHGLGLDLGNLVHVFHAFYHFAKNAVGPSRQGSELWLRNALSTRLMKNWAVALWGSRVRAMARVPRSFLTPLSASCWSRARGWAFRPYARPCRRPES